MKPPAAPNGREPLLLKKASGYDELYIFTRTMLVLALVLGIASGISAHVNALAERALAECAIVRYSLQDCMRSKGYLPGKSDGLLATHDWQSERLHRLVGDIDEAPPADAAGAE